MKKLFIGCLLSIGMLSAETIDVFGATATKLAMEELKKEFLKNRTEDSINLHIGASGKAYAQFNNGMKYDMFFSADRKYPESIKENGNASSNVEVYAYGVLTLYSLEKSLLKSDLSTMNSPKIKKIAIANPKLAPYGVAAMEILGKFPLTKEKIVMGDNVAQAVHFVDSGSADVGFIPYSLLKENEKISGEFVIIDKKFHQPLEHCFVTTTSGKEKKLTAEFSKFVLSTKGKAIIKKYGFETK